MKSLSDPLEIIFVVLNFVAQFRVPNVDHEVVNIHGSKFRDARVPTEITLYTVIVIIIIIWSDLDLIPQP